MKRSLRMQLLLPTLVVVAAGLLLAGYLSYRSAKIAFETELQHEVGEVATALSSQFDEWVGDLNRDIDLLARTHHDLFQQVIDGDSDAVSKANAVLKQFYDTYGVYILANVTNANGITVASSKAKLAGKQDLSGRGYFKAAVKGEKVLSDVLKSKSTGKPIFVLAHPLYDNGNVSGVLLGAVDLSGFSSRVIDSVKIGSEGYAYMVAPSGLIAAHPDRSAINQVNIKNYDWGKNILVKKGGLDIYKYSGVEKLVGYRTASTTGWTLCVGAATADVFSAVIGIRNQALICTGIILLVVAFVVVFIVTPVVKSLQRGVGFAEMISRGDLSQRLKLSREDELGDLGKALDTMADDLEARALLAKNIAEGDLRQEVSLADEKDMLGQSLKLMTANLRSIIGQVKASGNQISSGAYQVSESSQTLAQGATESAASLEEISASMNEMNTLTSMNAENVNAAQGLTGQVRTAASKGNEQMKEMMSAMVEINEASVNISKIIKVIDEIAFQTNLLALNAAVEAARAGSHGKGFAVVAEEVRNLAARSAKAASETAELIDGSVAKAQSGAEIADGTASALSDIIQGIHKVSDLVEEISTSSSQQASGISEINTGLGQVDQVTQQVTANSEESAATSEQLASQASVMQDILSKFKLPEGDTFAQAANQEPYEGGQLPAPGTEW